MAHISSLARKIPSPATVLILLATALAWYFRFIQDDAFISFRYARNLCEGHGLVFNIGERVEGYTNFLWTLLMAGGMKMGCNPVIFSQTMGILAYPVSLWLLFRITLLVFNNRRTAFYALLLTGTNYTYAAYATGGLETQLQSCLFLLILHQYFQAARNGTIIRHASLSVALGLAFLLRMDSALLIICILPTTLYMIWIPENPKGSRVWQTMAATVPAALIAGAWLLWKFSYYGHILPNTYSVKNPGLSAILPGFYYIALFFFSYGLLLLLVPASMVLRKKIKPEPALLVPALFLLMWLMYIVKVGGGFMEFRFMVPAIPVIALMAAWLLENAFASRRVQVGWLIVFIAISFFHSTRTRLYGVETIRGLEAHLTEGGWAAAGQTLGEQLNHDPGIHIATTAAGAIPYYSRLTTIDMLGLNDAWIAENGASTADPKRKWLGAKPGHRKKATMDYLLQRKVHLLIGHPAIVNRDAPLSAVTADYFVSGNYLALDPAPFPAQASLVRIPIDDQNALVAVYLNPHEAIDHAIKIYGWKVLPISQ
ncbi:MAG: hypothetical protein K9M45_02675 [Kiritimatiellales bacterium]|nr:hypothetical protein [Kiritimatiellales bacterium]